jgi:hypothetical protein
MEVETKRFLIKLAREVIESFVKSGNILEIPKNYPAKLNVKRGVFVTLFKREKGSKGIKGSKEEKLRGCIGLPYPQQSIIKNLREAAVSVTQDPRFGELREEELKDVVIEVSVLSKPKKIEVKKPEEYLKRIEPHKDGLIIKKDLRSGLFLPQVWEQLPNKKVFLANLCLKAGMMANEWMSEGAILYRFQVEKIREDELHTELHSVKS